MNSIKTILSLSISSILITVAFLLPFTFKLQAKTPLTYGHSDTIESKIMNQQRRYMVSLPERYYAETFSYPTLYVIDGDFQFHHVANTAKHLARMGKIPQIIVVGIANQGPKDYLFSNTWQLESEKEYGGIDLFNQYLKSELLPKIDQTFRTNSQKAIAGYSLGGLFVMNSYVDPSTPFNAFLAMSPSVWFDDYSFNNRLKNHLEKASESPPASSTSKPLFISLASEQGMGVEDLVKTLEKNNNDKISNWQYKHYPNETHYTTALPALNDGLQFLSPNHFVDMPELMKLSSVENIFENFKKKKSNWSGFRLDWLQSYTLAKYVIGSKKIKQIPKALEYTKQLFPESYSELAINFSLGLNKKEKYQQALDLLMSIENENANNSKWLYQTSIAYRGLGNKKKAHELHKAALKVAQSTNLESWEYWELEPYKLQNH
ncbi:MAG: hypothetical protein KUG78_19060 [Kangiellaceae bacterium]|nr:hypothetical protein [Kangiellaceae bacterium]